MFEKETFLFILFSRFLAIETKTLIVEFLLLLKPTNKMAGLFSDIKNKALNAALNIADTFTPILKESKFRETGLLTPDEFVAAGDFLTGHCPTWQWASGKVFKDYLPKDKQFLITKNVPCSKRCSHLMVKEDLEKVIETESGDGGWVDTHFYDSKEEGAAAANISANQVHEIGNDESVGKNVEYTKTVMAI